jgi:ubiquinone/menaquinone biosynthesis C-methylase UbiE
MLDLPSGVGRLYPAYKGCARRHLGMDISLEMLKFAREAMKEVAPGLAQSSATHIPLKDRAVDFIFSARLFHHLPDAEVRRRYILELCRVSRSWIVMTYFHTWSLKNILRRLRRPFNRKRPKVTMTAGELREMAGAAGWELVKDIPLSRLASGHHFAVLRRVLTK